MNPYDVLGVPRDAPQDEIKRAYRKLARLHHPDMNQDDKDKAEVRFKRVQQAYDMIGDPAKRSTYDTRSTLGNGFGPGFGTWFGFRPGGKGRMMRVAMDVSLEDVARGSSKLIRLQRSIGCAACSGSGAMDGKASVCHACGGTGKIFSQQRIDGITFKSSMLCIGCGGNGRRIEKPCHSCGGSGNVMGSEDIRVEVRAGAVNGETIMIQGKGEHGLSSPGDLYVVLRVKKHDRFTRIGNDLFARIEVPFAVALSGGKVPFKGLLDEDLGVDVPRACRYGCEVRLTGKGLSGGDLRIQVCYDLPSLGDDDLRTVLNYLP